MLESIRCLVNNHWKWLQDHTETRLVGESADWVEISLPYLDRHNDFLQFYVKQEGDSFLLTDDSATIHDLRMSGCDMDAPQRHNLVTTILNGLGVSREQDALTLRTSSEEFPQKCHLFVQAMLVVNDLFYTIQSEVSHPLIADVGGGKRAEWQQDVHS